MSELARHLAEKNIGKLEYYRVQRNKDEYSAGVHNAVTAWLDELSHHDQHIITLFLRKDLEVFEDCEVQLLVQLLVLSEPEISEPFTLFMRALGEYNTELQQQRTEWNLDPCPTLET